MPYSLVNRWPEAEAQPAAVELGLRSPASARLRGAPSRVPRYGPSVHGTTAVGDAFDFPPEQKQAPLELNAPAEKWGHKPAHLALAWLLSRPAVGSAIIGPETSAELTQNVGVFDVELDDAELAEIDANRHAAP